MVLPQRDAELIETWATHGMPENQSTRDKAVRLLVALRAENRELADVLRELTAAIPDSGIVTEYRLSLLPEDHVDHDLFCLRVRRRGDGRYAVVYGSRQCLGTDGTWDWERIPSERDDDWLDSHRFDLATALRLAEEVLPTIEVNGKTAADILAEKADR